MQHSTHATIYTTTPLRWRELHLFNLLKKYNVQLKTTHLFFNNLIKQHLHVYKCSHGLVQGVRPVHTFIQAYLFFLTTVAFGSLH